MNSILDKGRHLNSFSGLDVKPQGQYFLGSKIPKLTRGRPCHAGNETLRP